MTWLHDPATLLWLAFSVVVALIGATLAHDIYRDAAQHRDAEDVVRDLDAPETGECFYCKRLLPAHQLRDGCCGDCA